MHVPFLDLSAQYNSIKEEIDSAISKVVEDCAFVRGKYVSEFEKRYAKVSDRNFCISCANGTDAIYISLKALGIGRGDEVITTALSWISTSQTITQAGARVVFADIKRDCFTIDPLEIEKKITKKTKAIIPVHLYGQSADLDPILEIARRYGLYVIEDCAQAHFARYKGRKVGTFGICGTFSFYPGKNLGAYGDAGAIVSGDKDFSLRARQFANHGSLAKHQHRVEGINSRMDGIQAAVLLAKLPHIFLWNDNRFQHGKEYSRLLRDIDWIETPVIRNGNDHVFHLYVIRSARRDQIKEKLELVGIETGIHYPTALPFLEAYNYLGHQPQDFPIAYQTQSEILSLPMYPELTDKSQGEIAKAIRELE
jgi:dTDP-4-amino-4,6-dideoxygalactose transaminase